jgi:FeS assembly SUF system protein
MSDDTTPTPAPGTAGEPRAEGPAHGEISSVEQKLIEGQVVEAIRTCYDPEIPVNIYELGLIYEVFVDPEANVGVVMTLTSPHCPAAQSLPREVESKARAVPGVKNVKVVVVWDPPWNMNMMSEAARLTLGF